MTQTHGASGMDTNKRQRGKSMSLLLRFFKREDGAIAPLTALLLPVILGFAGLGGGCQHVAEGTP